MQAIWHSDSSVRTLIFFFPKSITVSERITTPCLAAHKNSTFFSFIYYHYLRVACWSADGSLKASGQIIMWSTVAANSISKTTTQNTLHIAQEVIHYSTFWLSEGDQQNSFAFYSVTSVTSETYWPTLCIVPNVTSRGILIFTATSAASKAHVPLGKEGPLIWHRS